MDLNTMPVIATRLDVKPDTHSGNTGSHSPVGHNAYEGEVSLYKAARSTSGPCQASQRHIKTEQKRRDRINDGFVALQALLPGKERVEKAVMLTQAADYIRQLQGLMQQVLSSGAAKALPNELQWNLRMLLPRKSDLIASGPGTDSTAACAPTVTVPTNPVMAPAPAPTPAPAPAPALEVKNPVVTAPVVAAPQYGLHLSEPHVQLAPQQPSLSMAMPQGQMRLSDAPGGGGSGGMLIADPHTLSQLQALVQQQQAVQGWHNASNLLQMLQLQQQLQQQQASSASMGMNVTPQMLQQLAASQMPGMHALFHQPATTSVSVGVPLASQAMPASMTGPTIASPLSASGPPLHNHQAIHAFPQAPQPSSTFAPAATSAFSSLNLPTSTSAFHPAGSANLSGLHQLMEAAHASDEERDGGVSFDMPSAKRARCYAAGPPRIAKAGILV